MLTPAQQKVKQELEELKASAWLHHEDEPNPSAPPFPFKKWALTVGGLALILVTLAVYFMALSGTKQEKAAAFLAKEQSYNQQSAHLLDEYLNNGSLNRQEARLRQEKLTGMIEDLPVPSGFKVHKQDLMKVFHQRLAIITYLADSDPIDQIELHKLLIELDVNQELAKDSLVNGFIQENIKHRLREDGTVQYWIRGNAFEYDH